jgi:hypothetical protein
VLHVLSLVHDLGRFTSLALADKGILPAENEDETFFEFSRPVFHWPGFDISVFVLAGAIVRIICLYTPLQYRYLLNHPITCIYAC